MYRPRAFVVDDIDVLHGVIRKRVFATLAAIIDGEIQFAYAPVILEPGDGALGGIRYHLAIGNPLAKLADGTPVRVGFLAADAYVSPDWYKTVVTVPTWNYVAVEGEGVVRRSSREELRQLVIDLSAQEEEKLQPKPVWKLEKVPEAKTAALLNGIVGFSLSFSKLEGKFKLSQDKQPEDVANVIAELEARGDAASVAVAGAMKKVGK
jgi:transcriptional regulator